MLGCAAHPILAVEGYESRLAIVAERAYDTFRPDDVASGTGNGLERIDDLWHDLGRWPMLAVVPYDLRLGEGVTNSNTACARCVGNLYD